MVMVSRKHVHVRATMHATVKNRRWAWAKMVAATRLKMAEEAGGGGARGEGGGEDEGVEGITLLYEEVR